MATVVRMPAALAGVTESAIQNWIAEVGQQIEVGDPFADIETEKAVVEYAAETGGTVARLLAEPGNNIAVGTPIALIVMEGDTDVEVQAALAAAGMSSAPEPTVTGVPADPEPETAPIERAAPEKEGSESRLFASPIVRRLARELGLDLGALNGTGPGGRIVRRDLEAMPVEPASAATPDDALNRLATATTSGKNPPGSTNRETSPSTDVPLNGMRRAIARRLTESKTTVPHFYLTAHCRVDALIDLRRLVNETAEHKISLNDFVLKAVAGALRRVPSANAIWGGDVIRRFEHVDLAVAVAVEGGLFTPVIRRIDELALSQVTAAVADVAARARAGRLRQDELEGGSFTVSNLGMFGVDEFAAILNPPQSGILAVGAATTRPVVDDGEVGVGTVMTVTLSADHRVMDGAVAAEWMAAFRGLIENPVGILV